MVAPQTASVDPARRAGTAGTVTVTDHDGIGSWLVGLDGEHDVSTVRLLEDDTGGVLEHCTRVVVDLSGASFIDCSVINWLMRTKRTLDAGGGRSLLVVDGAKDGTTARTIDAVGVREAFAFYPTRREAFAEAPIVPVTDDERWARARRRPNRGDGSPRR